MEDITVGSSEKISISIEELFNPNNVIHLSVPSRPTLKKINDNDLEDISYSAKEVADGYYELIPDNYDWFKIDIGAKSKFEMYLAIAGLACEIYLKAILYRCNGIKASSRKKHDLKELFILLDGCRHDLAERIISDVCKNDNTDFYEELDRSKDIFNEFRYSYELNGYTIHVLFVITFMNSLKEITDELFHQ